MSRSELEERLYGQMCLLAKVEGISFTLPVREYHPMWCCEHQKREHHIDDVGPWCQACVLLAPSVCHHFYRHERNWRVDFAWPGQRVIIEVEGGVWTKGRHTRGSGFTKDVEKYNALTAAGWTVYRVTQREVNSGEALRIAERALKPRPAGSGPADELRDALDDLVDITQAVALASLAQAALNVALQTNPSREEA